MIASRLFMNRSRVEGFKSNRKGSRAIAGIPVAQLLSRGAAKHSQKGKLKTRAHRICMLGITWVYPKTTFRLPGKGMASRAVLGRSVGDFLTLDSLGPSPRQAQADAARHSPAQPGTARHS